MCHRWCYGQVILQKWHILAGWVLTSLLWSCFAGVWITIGSPKAETTAGLLATGAVVTGLAVLFGLGSCLAGICAPSKSKLQYFVVASDQPAHVVVDPLEDLEAEVNKHQNGPPFPEMMPNGNRNGKVVRFAANSRARVANGKLPKQKNEQKRVEQKAIANVAAVAAAAAAVPLPEPAPANIDEEILEQPLERAVG